MAFIEDPTLGPGGVARSYTRSAVVAAEKAAQEKAEKQRLAEEERLAAEKTAEEERLAAEEKRLAAEKAAEDATEDAA